MNKRQRLPLFLWLSFGGHLLLCCFCFFIVGTMWQATREAAVSNPGIEPNIIGVLLFTYLLLLPSLTLLLLWSIPMFLRLAWFRVAYAVHVGGEALLLLQTLIPGVIYNPALFFIDLVVFALLAFSVFWVFRSPKVAWYLAPVASPITAATGNLKTGKD